MRTRFSTRALAAVFAVLGLAAFRAHPAGPGHEHKPPPEPSLAAATVMPIASLEMAYPADHEAGPDVSRSDAPAGLIWPAPGKITSPFGDHRNHPGLDIDGVTGDPVIAAGKGTVVQAGTPPSGYGGYGNLVVIDDGDGISTVYAHLSRVDVTVGQVLEQGQELGLIGSTGSSTGDHLHFEVRLANKPVDPMPYLPTRA